MCDPSESALDRHFESQVRILEDIYALKIRESDYGMSQRWLQVFQEAPGSEKYARNCLMLLMYSQLRELGRLGRPFTDMHNLSRQLEDVLSDFDGKLIDEDMETNASGYGSDTSRLSKAHKAISECDEFSKNVSSLKERLEGGVDATTPRTTTEMVIKGNDEFKRRTQENEELLKELDKLHTRSLKNELEYKSKVTEMTDLTEHKRTIDNVSKERSNAMAMSICRSTNEAIERIKLWTGGNDHLDFLATALRYFSADDPQLQAQLEKLDRKLEYQLENIQEQACERREKNVRIIYDQVFREQRDAQKQKDEQFMSERQAWALERQQLQQLLWKRDQRHQQLAQEQLMVIGTSIPRNPQLFGCQCECEQQSFPNCFYRQSSPDPNNCAQCQIERQQQKLRADGKLRKNFLESCDCNYNKPRSELNKGQLQKKSPKW
ncbi:uncharacterized protein LOC115633136 [Scaptodrosophila lebanonensis]|uniref:Uncharacterized protein LOC115633136 n=1 Tax=Drosophila lebanonensis TaxID=7225 RepID=A0A6J2UGZ3_DROLE|nr:uncharacterized protein LOC115633136 [Scaptodrosophila lebanonensis]